MQGFQSHLGLILTRCFGKNHSVGRSVSIPSWSDFNSSDYKVVSRHREISIPSWSDFNTQMAIINKRIFSEFQSHLGLILTAKMPYRKIRNEKFQSHLGLILTRRNEHNLIHFYEGISIPSWSDFNSIIGFSLLFFLMYFNPILV